MKIKLDENLPASLAGMLTELGHDVDTALDEGLLGEPDETVRAAAAESGRFLVTQDLDFSDIRRFQPGTTPGVMILRLDQPDGRQLARRVHEIFATNPVELWHGAMVIVTDTKIRVRAN